MKNLLLFTFLVLTIQHGQAQGNQFQSVTLPKSEKGKPVKYNAFGMEVLPSSDLIVGGNHISYRKIGFGISWRIGIQNIMINKQGFSDVSYVTADTNGWLTGNVKTSYSYGGMFNVVIPITKKIPFYIGAGVIRQRRFAELNNPFPNPTLEWAVDPDRTKFLFNFGAGVMFPVYNRLVFNIGYDHVPQSLFLGLTITDPFVYEDIDMW